MPSDYNNKFFKEAYKLPQGFTLLHPLKTPFGTEWTSEMRWDWGGDEVSGELDRKEWKDSLDRWRASEIAEDAWRSMQRAERLRSRLLLRGRRGHIRWWWQFRWYVKRLIRLESRWNPGAPQFTEALNNIKES